MRLKKVREMMEKANLDGVLITQSKNRHYLSGFTGSNGVLIITKEKQILATDFRYYEQVSQQCPDWELAKLTHPFTKTMLEILRGLELGGRAVGFETESVTVDTLHSWERAIKGQLILVHTKGLVESLRMQKDSAEIDKLRKAIALADETVNYITGWIRPGMRETEVAWEIESYMRTHGASAISFEPIVASGPNGSKPHAEPSDRIIQPGEPIILDFGCVVDDYCSDITRTVCIGEPADNRYLEIWQLVRHAQESAIAGAKAGMTGVEVDKIARDIIEEAGFKDYFGHGLGHGVGLAVHEEPRFSFTYPEAIPVGAIVTAEPGIYIPEWGGVRIEDIVLVHEDCVEILTNAPKEPII
jgi:Xaa-Pro aminopeptidase